MCESLDISRSTTVTKPYIPLKASDILPCSIFFSLAEETFIEQVYKDAFAFASHPTSSSSPAVFVFPAVSPRLRFLIHQVVESNFESLKTFSIGTIERRTVICPKSIYMEKEKASPLPAETSPQPRKTRVVNERAIYRPPPARSSGKPLQDTTSNQNVDQSPVLDSTKKKPAQALYVPPRRNKSGEPQVKPEDLKDETKALPTVSPQAKDAVLSTKRNRGKKKNEQRNDIRLAAEEEETNQTPSWKEETSATHTPTQANRKISRTGSIPVVQPSGQSSMDLADLMESRELAELSNDVPIEKLASPNDLRTRKFSNDEDLDSWDALYNETGDLLRPEALEELTLAVGSVRVLQPPSESYSRGATDTHDEDLDHVIELYDFPSAFKTEDLFNALSIGGKPPDFSLKWVDDTHALAIYSSPYAAVDALAAGHCLVKMRPLAQAAKDSRNCARRISTALQPFKPRPATSASMAKRLVSTALGLKNTVSPEQRKMERQMLADAKAKKRLAAQQREAAWDGEFTEP